MTSVEIAQRDLQVSLSPNATGPTNRKGDWIPFNPFLHAGAGQQRNQSLCWRSAKAKGKRMPICEGKGLGYRETLAPRARRRAPPSAYSKKTPIRICWRTMPEKPSPLLRRGLSTSCKPNASILPSPCLPCPNPLSQAPPWTGKGSDDAVLGAQREAQHWGTASSPREKRPCLTQGERERERERP